MIKIINYGIKRFGIKILKITCIILLVIETRELGFRMGWFRIHSGGILTKISNYSF